MCLRQGGPRDHYSRTEKLREDMPLLSLLSENTPCNGHTWGGGYEKHCK